MFGVYGVCVVVHCCWSKMAVMVCVCMSASPSLPHSSQNKEFCQKRIKYNEEVSDECSSGVMRVVHVDHSIPGVCSLYAVFS